MSIFVGCFIGKLGRLVESFSGAKRFSFINWFNRITVLSESHLAANLSEIFGIGSTQCVNLAGFFAKLVRVKQYNLTRNSSLTTNAWLNRFLNGLVFRVHCFQ